MTNQLDVARAKRGQPPLFSSPKELQDKIDKYFELCEKNDEIPLLSGLAVNLGCDRRTLANYDTRDDYFRIISDAKTRCEYALEKKLVNKETYATGQIFALKNGYGWKEQVEHTGDVGNNTVNQEIVGAFAQILKEQMIKKIEGEVVDNDE